MARFGRGARIVGLALASACAVPAGSAHGDDVRVTADTAFRIYEVRSPITPVVWTRRRLVQTLGFRYARRFTNPRDRDRAPVRFATSVRLRLDQDFGDTCFVDRDGCVNARNPADEGDYLPLARNGRVDVPSAWAELQGLPGGLSMRIGRQLRRDAVGFLRIDGWSARVEPVPWAATEAYAGLVVRNTSLAGADAFQPQGSLRLDLPDEVDPDRVPFVDSPANTWTVGGSLELGRTRWARGHVGFREVRDEAGLVSRRLTAGLTSRPVDRLRVQAETRWDVTDGTLVDALASVDLLLDEVTIRTRLERHVPVFDLGSIWTWFDLRPVDEGRVSVTWRPVPQFDLGGALLGRRTRFQDRSNELGAGFEGWGGLHINRWRVEVFGAVQDGDLGPVARVRLRATWQVLSWIRVSARGSVWHFDDRLRQGMFGTSVTEAVSMRFQLSETTGVRGELQHSHSRVVGHRIQGLMSLGIEMWR